MFSGTAENLAKEFATDKDAFGKKYKDQIVEIEGEVDDPKLTSEAFTLTGYQPKEGGLVLIGCYPDKDNLPKMTGLTNKKKVKVRGKVVSRNTPFVEIIECQVN